MNDRQRLVLAVVLMLLVWFVPTVIWGPKKPAGTTGVTGGRADTTAVGSRTGADTSTARASGPSSRQPVGPSKTPAIPSDTGRIVWVTSPLYRFGFSTHGGRLVSAELTQYQSFAPGDSAKPVDLVPPGSAFLRHRLVLPSGDTVSLDDWNFQPTPDVSGLVVYTGQGQQSLRFDADRGGAHVTLEYRFVPDEYRFDVAGTVRGMGNGGA
ncbi:MAG TPA: YidC/Oxa1 family insertase periplasmic-domain containing protein, partial [Gemmatimonadales bacterium]|nr:YidC/Oxa1 family insertase periplasmic-domain containing protein [Gemmatimonadales bacterium]